MTLRIGHDEKQPGAAVRLEGRLSSAELPELQRVIAGARGSRLLRIDVKQLMSADAEGLAVLKRLRDDGAVLEGASPYLRLALGETLE